MSKENGVGFLITEIDRVDAKVNRDMSDKWRMFSDLVKKVEELEDRVFLLENKRGEKNE
jgi:hypothetical protein